MALFHSHIAPVPMAVNAVFSAGNTVVDSQPHTAPITFLMAVHVAWTMFLNVSLRLYSTTIPATKPAIAAIIRPIGLAVSAIFNSACTAAHALVATVMASITVL
ncbi:Uncharacterised protein [Mycobacteroides abscessus subsp. abscessus]|nr:Uncharacterised protein [Mycobacteroides abscessus subsp. abscessus]SKP85816.1 Uncharacterised protein [Mycobacteroides abscessus subsp. abscessus]